MNKVKSQNSKFKTTTKNLKFCVLVCSFAFCVFTFALSCFAQTTDDLELTLDANAATTPLPKIFKPNIDLSGRGFHNEPTWPQELASKESLDTWQKDIGFNDFYRMQYNLWEISQFTKDKEGKDKLLANYEAAIKNVNDAGGIVILDIFGTPAGMGKVLDKKSAPVNLPAFKELIKNTIKDLSCEKKYNIWYEVWNAPDLDDFFLGREQEYLNLYSAVAESINELELQYKIHIPVGGSSASWWFHNLEDSTIFTPEKSLIYELIKFCYRNHLPLDFITWHGYSCDPKAEKENTIYNKNAASLIRDWLSYFNLDKSIPLIVDEWNYDRDANILPERKEKSYISASFIPARIKNMYEAGIDNQVYFSLEDFQNNTERVTRNVGVFSFGSGRSQYKVYPKAAYNVFRMLKELGPDMLPVKLNDEFIGAIAAKSDTKIAVLIYNYIDPEIVKNYLSGNIAALNPAESKFLLNIIRSDQLVKIVSRQEENTLARSTNKVKALLKKAQELNDMAIKFSSAKRDIKINMNNIKGDYFYRVFTVDSSCGAGCEFKPAQEKEITITDSYQGELSLDPYSVYLIIFEKKPTPPAAPNPPDKVVAPQEEVKKDTGENLAGK